MAAGRSRAGPTAIPDPVAAWRSTTARAGRLVKAVIPGPYSTGSDGTRERAWLRDLAEAGCRWVEVHEPGAVAIGADDAARARFSHASSGAHRRPGWAAPEPGRHRRQRRRGRHRDAAGRRLQQPGRRPHRRAGRVVPRGRRAGDHRDRGGRAGRQAWQRRRPGGPALGGGLCRLDRRPRDGPGRPRHRQLVRGPAVGRGAPPRSGAWGRGPGSRPRRARSSCAPSIRARSTPGPPPWVATNRDHHVRGVRVDRAPLTRTEAWLREPGTRNR